MDFIKEEIVKKINELGFKVGTYDELSGGEKQVCNLCMAFAMHEALTASKGINLAFLDEVFESLSSYHRYCCHYHHDHSL